VERAAERQAGDRPDVAGIAPVRVPAGVAPPAVAAVRGDLARPGPYFGCSGTATRTSGRAGPRRHHRPALPASQQHPGSHLQPPASRDPLPLDPSHANDWATERPRVRFTGLGGASTHPRAMKCWRSAAYQMTRSPVVAFFGICHPSSSMRPAVTAAVRSATFAGSVLPLQHMHLHHDGNDLAHVRRIQPPRRTIAIRRSHGPAALGSARKPPKPERQQQHQRAQALRSAADERIGEQSDGRLWYHLRCLADRGSPKMQAILGAGSRGPQASC
jgi:hypothetical protein